MKRIKLKKFDQFVNERFVDYDVDYAQPEVELLSGISERYEKRYIDQLLMEDVVKEDTYENKNEIIEKISNGGWETTPEEFLNSVNSSKRVEYMTSYTIEELSTFKLFKLEGYNIGFALKEDDIILVHNNEGIGGIGKLLINKAIEFGGNKLDHFDGFLTGFYRSLGFVMYSNDFFLDEYAPDTWKFEPLDINDPAKSIYAGELMVRGSLLESAKIRYESGRPDVVYRVLKMKPNYN
jgi:hypothetical protein